LIVQFYEHLLFGETSERWETEQSYVVFQRVLWTFPAVLLLSGGLWDYSCQRQYILDVQSDGRRLTNRRSLWLYEPICRRNLCLVIVWLTKLNWQW